MAVIGFVSALSFFLLIAAATIASAMTSDSHDAAGGSGSVPHTPAGIFTALAIVSGGMAILFSMAGLVQTRRVASDHGTIRTTGRGMAIAGLSVGGGGLLITVIVLSTVVPVMNRQREMGRREQCKVNLQAIAAALAGYANSNTGHYPDSLAVLVGNGTLPPDALICLSTTDTPTTGPTSAAQVAALGQPGHNSYVYVGKGITIDSPNKYTVLVYEPPDNHGEIAHVLFLDGYILPVQRALAEQLRRELDTGQNPGTTAQMLRP